MLASFYSNSQKNQTKKIIKKTNLNLKLGWVYKLISRDVIFK